MVKRRKVLIGAGSLLAGGAAATGTGAFTNMESGDRTTNVTVTQDADGFIGLEGLAPWANGDSTDGGKLELDFTGAVTYGYGGDGVNPDSTYRFDDVFKITNGLSGENEDGDTLAIKPYVFVETSGFDVDIDFYVSATDAGGNMNKQAESPYVPYDTSITGEANEEKINVPGAFWVGVKIKPGSSPIEEAGGDIVIHATAEGEEDRFPLE